MLWTGYSCLPNFVSQTPPPQPQSPGGPLKETQFGQARSGLSSSLLAPAVG